MTIPNILVIILAIIWLCFSIVFFITTIQTFIYNHKHEVREKEAQKRDIEYHKARMKAIENK